AVAVAEIQDNGERVVLLRMRGQKVDEKTLAAAGRAQHERVPDVFDVEIERVGRMVRRLEDGERLSTKMAAGALAGIQSEQEAEIRGVRLKDGESSQIVSAVSGNDAQPGVQQIVRLLEQAAVVHRHGLLRFGSLVLERLRVLAVEDNRQRCAPKEMSVDL